MVKYFLNPIFCSLLIMPFFKKASAIAVIDSIGSNKTPLISSENLYCNPSVFLLYKQNGTERPCGKIIENTVLFEQCKCKTFDFERFRHVSFLQD